MATKNKNIEPTWNLEAMYPDVKAWEKDFAKIRPLAEKFASYKGHLAEGPKMLLGAIETGDEFDRLSEKCYVYAHLRSDEDTSNNANRTRLDKVASLCSELAPLESWFEPEFMALDDATIKKYLAAPELAFYKRSIQELLREREHILSEAEERVLGLFGEVFHAPDKIFGILNDSDLEFGKIKGENGKPMSLTHSSYGNLLESPQREVRKRAFHKLYGVYRQHRNTFAATLDTTVRRHVVSAKVRRYPSALAQSLSSDNVPESVYRNLISAVHDGLPAFYDYLDLRAKVLELPDINMYDLHTPLLPKFIKNYTFDDAVKMVKKALSPLGEEYVKSAELAFSQCWIDAPERKGKRSGAYSSGCYDSYPYMLLNFNRTLNAIFTLAHELGHSMHSFFSNKYQKYHYADYSIFVAEVASITNEILLFESLLKQNKDDVQFCSYLLDYMATEIRATIYRQTMFAEFELKIHELVEQGEILSADVLSENYYELNKLYHGPQIVADRDIELEWSRIPHFYYNFYVYKYATGMSAALQCAANLLSGDADKREAYLGFLKAGDSKDVLDIMSDAGVNLATPQPIKAALNRFQQITVDLRKTLLK